MNCCLCENEHYSKCSNGHRICKNCFISILTMCYCKSEIGNVLYICPMCREEHIYTNIEINVILLELLNSNNMCLPVHKKCQDDDNCCNIIKKCEFEKCGCRINHMDIIVEEDFDLAMKDIILNVNHE